MRPYGWKQWEWRDEDHAPCTRYVGHGIRSPQRKQRRRKLHQRARRAANSEIASEIDSTLAEKEFEDQHGWFDRWYRSEQEEDEQENIESFLDRGGEIHRSHLMAG